jgi:DeoR/GlpR family transcriptional regulator of sugar metabolism
VSNDQEVIIPAERRNRILDYIKQNRSVRIEELASTLDVSEATVRRDLDWLANEGLISRTHGGAVILKKGCFIPKRNAPLELRQRIWWPMVKP